MLQVNGSDRREYGTNGETRSLADVAAELRIELGDRDHVLIENADDPTYRADVARRARALSGAAAPMAADTLPDAKTWRIEMNRRMNQIAELRKDKARRAELELMAMQCDVMRVC